MEGTAGLAFVSVPATVSVLPRKGLRLLSPFLRKVLDAFALAVVAWLGVGWGVRLTVRDAFPIASTVFYASPWPVLAALGAALCVVSSFRRRRIVTGAAALLALGAAVGLFLSLALPPPAASSPSDLRVVFWNVGRPTEDLPRVLGILRAHDADIIGIDETGDLTQEAYRSWQMAFPGYQLSRKRSSGMMILTRGEILHTEKGSLGARGRFLESEVRLRGALYRILLVDMAASPLRSRRTAFRELLRRIDADADGKLILMGDFNTPVDSVHFDVVHTRLANAFETAGRGYSATWPVPIPVMALDHVWVDREIEVTGCSLGFSLLSDHRLVAATLRAGR